MHKIFQFFLFYFVLTGSVISETQYNPFSNEWETTNYGDTLEYNPFSNDWEYAAPDSSLEYNPFTGDWEYAY